MAVAGLLLSKYWPQLALLAGVVLLWGYANELWCNAPCQRAKKAGAECESRVASAQQRATDLALLYAKTLDGIDARVRQQKEIDRVAFDALGTRAHALPAIPTVHLSFDAFSLWRDASDAANRPDPTGSQPRAAGATAAVPAAATTAQDGGGGGDAWFSEQDLDGFNVAAADAYKAAVQKWRGSVAAFDALRSSCQQLFDGSPTQGATP